MEQQPTQSSGERILSNKILYVLLLEYKYLTFSCLIISNKYTFKTHQLLNIQLLNLCNNILCVASFKT
jgi:hypothetical protein